MDRGTICSNLCVFFKFYRCLVQIRRCVRFRPRLAASFIIGTVVSVAES